MLEHKIAGTVNIVTATPLALHALCFLLIQNSPYEVKSSKMEKIVNPIYTWLNDSGMVFRVNFWMFE